MDWFDTVLTKAGDAYGKFADVRMAEATAKQAETLLAIEREQAAGKAPVDAKASASATPMPTQAAGFDILNLPRHYYHYAAVGFAAVAIIGLMVRK